MAERTGPVKEKFLTGEAGKETLEQLLLHQVSQVQTTSGRARERQHREKESFLTRPEAGGGETFLPTKKLQLSVSTQFNLLQKLQG